MSNKEGFFIDTLDGLLKIEKDAESELNYTLGWEQWLDADTIISADAVDVGTDIAMTLVSLNTGTLTSAIINFTTKFRVNDLINITGFLTNSVNNGQFRVTSVSANSMVVFKVVDTDILVNEAMGDSITLTNPKSAWLLPSPLREYKPSIVITDNQTIVFIADGIAGTNYLIVNRIRTTNGQRDERSFTVIVVANK